MRALCAALLLLPAPAFAADCTLATAIYRRQGVRLRDPLQRRGPRISALSETNTF